MWTYLTNINKYKLNKTFSITEVSLWFYYLHFGYCSVSEFQYVLDYGCLNASLVTAGLWMCKYTVIGEKIVVEWRMIDSSVFVKLLLTVFLCGKFKVKQVWIRLTIFAFLYIKSETKRQSKTNFWIYPAGSKAKIAHSRSLTALLEEDEVLDSGIYQLCSRKCSV